jgi:hypothetical protein
MSWDHHKPLIQHQLKKLEEASDEQLDILRRIEVDIAQLKIKATLWGAAAGAVPVIVATVIKYI